MKHKQIIKVIKDGNSDIRSTTNAFCCAIDNSWTSPCKNKIEEVVDILCRRYQSFGNMSLIIKRVASIYSGVEHSNKKIEWHEQVRPVIMKNGLANVESYFLKRRNRNVKKSGIVEQDLKKITDAIKGVEVVKDFTEDNVGLLSRSSRNEIIEYLYSTELLLVKMESLQKELASHVYAIKRHIELYK